MKKKTWILIGTLLAGATGLVLYAAQSRNLWMIVYFKEALNNTLHPYCPSLPPNVKPVLGRGTSVEAKTTFAVLKIESLDDQTRRYRWRSHPNDVWNEELIKLKGGDGRNLNYPGNRSEDLPTFFGWKRNIIAFEGDQNCSTQAELNYWLKNYQLTHGAVYNQSGLLIGCRPESPDFQVIQFKLNGQIPKDLPTVNDSAISISH